jgi:hypothetical protein
MKPSPILAAALLLAACASTGRSPAAAPATSAAAGTYYCWKDRLASEGDDLVCNWEPSANAACRSDAVVSLSRAAVASGPVDSRRCENGQWLVSATTK